MHGSTVGMNVPGRVSTHSPTTGVSDGSIVLVELDEGLGAPSHRHDPTARVPTFDREVHVAGVAREGVDVGACCGGADLVEFMEEVARRTPGKVVIIWDNLNIHHEGKHKRWSSFNERHDGRFTFVHTPTHASWLNQVKCWFSILDRRVLRHASFKTVEEVNARVDGCISHWNDKEAHPFNWTFRGTFSAKQGGDNDERVRTGGDGDRLVA